MPFIRKHDRELPGSICPDSVDPLALKSAGCPPMNIDFRAIVEHSEQCAQEFRAREAARQVEADKTKGQSR